MAESEYEIWACGVSYRMVSLTQRIILFIPSLSAIARIRPGNSHRGYNSSLVRQRAGQRRGSEYLAPVFDSTVDGNEWTKSGNLRQEAPRAVT